MRLHRAFVPAILVVLTTAPFSLGGIGKSRVYDAKDGSKQDTVFVGDLIKITLDDQLVAADTTPQTDLIEGDAVRFVALVKDGKQFVAYYSPDKKGAAKVQFSYTKKDGGLSVLVVYDFAVKTQTIGRTLEVTGNGVTDTATGNPPVGGVKVGDVLRLKVRQGVPALKPFVTGGDSVKVVNTVEEGGGLAIYFSTEKAGTVKAVGYSTGPPGDGGFISQPIEVFPN